MRNLFMCYNTQLRTLYDTYACKRASWLHDGSYAADLELRPSFGLLAMNVWHLVQDAGLSSEQLPLEQVNRILTHACKASEAVRERRARVLEGANAAGVWTFEVPLHSPFRVRCACGACL